VSAATWSGEAGSRTRSSRLSIAQRTPPDSSGTQKTVARIRSQGNHHCDAVGSPCAGAKASASQRHHDDMPAERTQAGALYDVIGQTYSGRRRTDPKIAARIWDALGDAETVLNVGAGTGSYEPPGRNVTGVEPSAVMRAQRPQSTAPCINARAAALPSADGSFDVAMAVLSDHHWADPIKGLRELRDYLPEFRGGSPRRLLSEPRCARQSGSA
jgi:SAM-dependent methyltransferase